MKFAYSFGVVATMYHQCCEWQRHLWILDSMAGNVEAWRYMPGDLSPALTTDARQLTVQYPMDRTVANSRPLRHLVHRQLLRHYVHAHQQPHLVSQLLEARRVQPVRFSLLLHVVVWPRPRVPV